METHTKPTAQRTLTLTVEVEITEDLTATVQELLAMLDERLDTEEPEEVYETFFDTTIEVAHELDGELERRDYEAVERIENALIDLFAAQGLDASVSVDFGDCGIEDAATILQEYVEEAHPFPS